MRAQLATMNDAKRFGTSKLGFDIASEADWPAHLQWLVDALVRLDNVTRRAYKHIAQRKSQCEKRERRVLASPRRSVAETGPPLCKSIPRRTWIERS
ncbi:hypothetical protein [Paraburkholderia diazotrophica]|uniref:hypothetical protein n=1 Tax=Paraburkholderia diazotrophica TaxID=667676 RepID=UPI00115F7DA8|nr:hypothetical protein [Paraburkholderia diazotrophica]